MRAIEIQRNGLVICTAGFPGAISLGVNLDGDCETAVQGCPFTAWLNREADSACTCGGSTTCG